ncbi:MAG: hypothetical protein U1D55_15260 [Phycisphaerae bacterium]
MFLSRNRKLQFARQRIAVRFFGKRLPNGGKRGEHSAWQGARGPSRNRSYNLA